MMLVLAVRTDRSGSTGGRWLTSPKPSRRSVRRHPRGRRPDPAATFMKRRPRDLLGEFRALAPDQPPIVLQRWNIRRITLAVAMLALITAAVGKTWDVFFPAARNLGVYAPACGTGHSMTSAPRRFRPPHCCPASPRFRRAGQLAARTSPAGRPASGWTPIARDREQSRDPDRGLRHLRRPADPLRPARHAAVRAAAEPGPAYSGIRCYTFPGGCAPPVRFRPALPGGERYGRQRGGIPAPSALVRYIRRTEGLTLCGRGAGARDDPASQQPQPQGGGAAQPVPGRPLC